MVQAMGILLQGATYIVAKKNQVHSAYKVQQGRREDLSQSKDGRDVMGWQEMR